MLAYEIEYLTPLVPAGATLLDLGSGFGELSKAVTPADGRLIAVDSEPGMAAGFAGDARFTFETADVAGYHPAFTADVILLYGVVTHLTVEEEEAVYDTMRRTLRHDGLAVVKNQCSDAEGFQVDTHSEALGTRYVGRYPSIAEQTSRLSLRFGSVEARPYPAELRQHPNSAHVAFYCREPLAP
jgi:cyclopropane fatty-acyl-phospholipid synthase-like methyltransferase